MPSSHRLVASFLALVCTASCSEEIADPLDVDVDVDNDFRLYGDILYGSDCTPDHRALVEKGVEWGRIASRSPAFRGCVADSMANYVVCGDEPFANDSLAVQIDGVLAITQTPNDISMDCTGAPAGFGGQASYQGYGHGDAEEFEWGPFLTTMSWAHNAPRCTTCQVCASNPVLPGCYEACGPAGCSNCNAQTNCRAQLGWPWSTVARTTWHEVSHTHDYRHVGPNEDCHRGDSNYDPNTQSVPYIVGSCMEETIKTSALECGEDYCAPHSRPILEGGSCVCRRDPGVPYPASFGAPVRGDFNNDGTDDIVYYGVCGAGALECWRGHLGSPSGFNSVNLGGNVALGANQHHSSPVGGDFDNDGYEDDILYYGSCGPFHSCWRAHRGDGIDLETVEDFGDGAWFATTDARSTPVAGDFDNDGYVDDVAYYGNCGSGGLCWRVHRSDGSQFASPWNFGGGMDFGGSEDNRRPVSGDFDADGFVDDIAYYGNCGGNGCWKVHLGTGTSFTTTDFGVSLAFFAGADPIHAPVAGDFDDDGAFDDLAYYGTCPNAPDCWRVRRGNGTPGGATGTSFSSASLGAGPWFQGSTSSHAPVSGNFSGAGGDLGEIVYWGRCGGGFGAQCWRKHNLFSGGLSTANFGANMWFPPM